MLRLIEQNTTFLINAVMNFSTRFFACIATSSIALGIAPVLADTGSNTTASVPDLSPGMVAPGLDVGTDGVQKGTIQYSNSVGSSDAFSVGASTIVGASVNASSTPDYSVKSDATFGIQTSTINQVIGTSNISEGPSTTVISDVDEVATSLTQTEVEKDFTEDTTSSGNYWWWYNRRNKKRTRVHKDELETVKTEYSSQIKSDITETLTRSNSMSGTISGSFAKSFSDDSNSNTVTVNGIGTNAKLVAAEDSQFASNIVKLTPGEGEDPLNTGAGTASGGASGSVGTTATANANSSQFVSSFAQAY